MATEPPPGVRAAMEPDGGPGTRAGPSVSKRLAEETATANTIYGIIVCSAVLVSGYEKSAVRLAVAALSTLVIYWSAERYAHLMARRIVDPTALTWTKLVRELRPGWELVTA